jgi:hypothetical protein
MAQRSAGLVQSVNACFNRCLSIVLLTFFDHYSTRHAISLAAKIPLEYFWFSINKHQVILRSKRYLAPLKHVLLLDLTSLGGIRHY